ELYETLKSWHIPYNIASGITSFPEYWEFSNKLEKQGKSWEEIRDLHELEIKVWESQNLDKLKENCKGKIFIYSATDNSIPYEMFSEIENLFNADRIHLG